MSFSASQRPVGRLMQSDEASLRGQLAVLAFVALAIWFRAIVLSGAPDFQAPEPINHSTPAAVEPAPWE
ncbi:hypothetical protein Pla175_21980 [Pirellulimonas nuda]|uniref:Uncharacterized protein n=1 Tax=Pirellulimonas nuda TaxID=2528009 RepID=A0A518DBF3_9BACT|nr:hypothetical protein Pla175_21980 [Pirellulimonas nuda]